MLMMDGLSKRQMLAVVNHGPEDFRLEEVDIPQAGPEEVVAKVLACGICGSDIKCYHGAKMYWDGPSPLVKAPVIPGHEFVAEVVELGPGAADRYGLEPGDKVVSEQIVPCWECRFCKTGRYWLCQTNNVYGFQGGINDGGMAEYIKFPRNAINHKVPKNLPDRVGAMIEPLSCAIHAVERAHIELGDVVVIAGAGPLGLSMLQVAKLKSPDKLVVLDVKPNRLEVARKLGADLAINVDSEDALAAIKDLTAGYGCDVYIEASGYPASVPQGLNMIRKQGKFVAFGVYGRPVDADWGIVGDQKELTIYGSHLGPYCYPLAIDYLARGTVRVDDIVTHVFPLKEFKQAFEIAMGTGEPAIKVLLQP